jgi:hypothetical protein
MELHSEFSDIREINGELWGRFRFERPYISTDLHGTAYPNPDVQLVDFAIIEELRQFLIGFAKSANSTELRRTLNDMLNYDVPAIKTIRITGENLRAYLDKHEYRAVWSLMRSRLPHWRTIGISGGDIEKQPMFRTLQEMASETDWMAFELMEYRRIIGIHKSGIIIDYRDAPHDEFLEFIRGNILPMVSA